MAENDTTKLIAYKSLLAAQKAMPDLQKNAINPHFGSSYISLDSLMEQVLPVLNEHGFVLLQSPVALPENEPGLMTTLLHVETGEGFGGTMPLMVDKANPQGQGSAITYARRYALMSLLGLVADVDDDANSASTTTKKRTTKPKASTGNEHDERASGGFDDGDSPF